MGNFSDIVSNYPNISYVVLVLSFMSVAGLVVFRQFSKYKRNEMFAYKTQIEFDKMQRAERDKKFNAIFSITSRLAHDVLSDVQAVRDSFDNIQEIMENASIEDQDLETTEESLRILSVCINRIQTSLVDIVKKNRDSSASMVKTKASAVDLHKSIEDSIEIFKKSKISQGISMEFVCQDKNVTFITKSWYQDVRSGILNVLNNSAYAMRDIGGSIKITLSPEYSRNGLSKRINVNIRDTGKGIPKHRLEKIFEPFETFGKESGSGIGLSSLFETVHKSKGDVEATSELGSWTNIRITLPAYENR